MFQEGKDPDTCLFISRRLDPDCPKPHHSYALAATAGVPKKGNKLNSSLTVAQVASVSHTVPAILAPKWLSAAERRLYPPRSTPSLHNQAPLIAATFPNIVARDLRDPNCALPLAVKTKVNRRGSVILPVTNATTPVAAFAPYCDALTTQLNPSFPLEDSPSLPFGLSPNEVQLPIHSLPIAFLPQDPGELFPSLAVSIYHSKNIGILAARFVNPNAESWSIKTVTSIIVSVTPGDVFTMGSSLRLFSRFRTIERAYPSQRYTQCRNCGGFGHITPRCVSRAPVCPQCSLNHTQANQRCPNLLCPGSGNLKAISNCCSSSPASCVNCCGNHSALCRNCETRPSPPTLRRSPPQKTSYPRQMPKMRWTRPPTAWSSRPPLH